MHLTGMSKEKPVGKKHFNIALYSLTTWSIYSIFTGYMAFNQMYITSM